MIVGLERLTSFHTEYGTPSRPGAEEGENLERASFTSSVVWGAAEGFLLRRPLLGRRYLGGNKSSSKALLMATGPEVWGREGTPGVFLGATSCLAVQMLLGEVFVRKLPQ